MKPSPLQLDAVFYPEVSYRAVARPELLESEESLPVQISAFVTFRDTGVHSAFLQLEQPNESGEFAFSVKVTVFCGFRLDVDVAKSTYPRKGMPLYVATNVARLLYSGAREMVASTTARSPFGSARIDSVLIEKDDVQIEMEGEGDADQVARRVFRLNVTTGEDIEDPDVSADMPAAANTDRPVKRRKNAKRD